MPKPFVPQRLPLPDVAWEPLIPLIGRANRALAHYDGVLYGVPNPEVLLAPLITQEAVLSSRIEGTQATLGDVLKFEAGEEPRQPSRLLDIQEIINYREALRTAKARLKKRPFNLNLLLELHAILLDSVRGRDKGRGRFRNVQNWIGQPGSTIETATFVPPEPHLLPDLLGNWEKYYHSEGPDPLVQLAVIHGQFEIIHPFVDGNGRLGRILVPLFLYETKILAQPTYYLSAYLEAHRETYIERLRGIGRSSSGWNRWIEFFLTALIEQARLNAAKARDIIDLYESKKKQVAALTHSRFAIPLLDALFEKPVLRVSDLTARRDMPSKAMILRLLVKLMQGGVLEVLNEGAGSGLRCWRSPS